MVHIYLFHAPLCCFAAAEPPAGLQQGGIQIPCAVLTEIQDVILALFLKKSLINPLIS